MDDTTEHKTRRPHRKSRNGCTRCKERRIKCDELTPRCSRCHRMNLDCQYVKRQPFAEDAADPIDALLLQLQVSPHPGSPESSGHESASSPLSTASSASLLVPRHEKRPGSPLRMTHMQTLAPAELDLFKHYLEHTSKDLTVDEDDQYTLQVGIPNLACQSKPLMRSVLALAAICRCCDMIGQPDPGRAQVAELLALADGYHMESLREIQATLPKVKQYDHVLANAAMMGMYGSGSHRTRIWLAQTAHPDAPYPMPKHSQWISLFRAAYLAYAGLLPPESPHSPAAFDYKLTPHLTSPLPPIFHPLSPLLAATITPALAKLHAKSLTLPAGDPDVAACQTALTLLTSVAARAFAPADPSPTVDVEIDPGAGRLAEVSPWLRRYTASITSMVPSRLPRRTIMAFIHKAPAGFLGLVEDMISLMQAAPGEGAAEGPGVAHRFAMEVFAHWLVLVVLLDNVWWIGGIGAWELGRIVQFRRGCRWGGDVWGGGDWWPEGMWEVARQFERFRGP